LKLCKIRKITKAQVINTDFPLIKLKLISIAPFLKKAKRERPAQVSNAYEYDSASDDENTESHPLTQFA